VVASVVCMVALLAVWAFPLARVTTAAPSQVWVDDDYSAATPGWGTIRFASIPPALAAVADGGEVIVAPGRYAAPITITKPVRLRGAGRSATILYATSGTAITVAAPNVVVDGVGVVNEGAATTGVRITGDCATFGNSRVVGFLGEAVFGTAPKQTVILANDIADIGGEGVYIQGTDNATVSFNQFLRVQGTALSLERSKYGLVAYNEIAQANAPAQWGIAIIGGSESNTITQNRIHDNNLAGAILVAGPNNTLRENTIADNTGDGIRLVGGASGSTVDAQTITGNGRRGIALVGAPLASVRILNNRIIGNGFALSEPALLIESATTCTLHGNQFSGNARPARDDGAGNVWYNAATRLGNFWDDYSGPDANADGIGDTPYAVDGLGHAVDAYPVLLLSLRAEPPSVGADTSGYSLLTASLRDVQLRPIQGGEVVFRTNLGQFISGTNEYTTTAQDGVASAKLYADGTPGTATVVVSDTVRGISVSGQVFFAPCGYQKWQEPAPNPVFTIADGDAAAPSVLFNPAWSTPYRMWYSTASGIAYAESYDGIAWLQKGLVTGLRNARQGRVLYDSGGFGGGARFRIWYRDSTITFLPSAIRYAESDNGLAWSNDQAIAQDAANPLVIGTAGWNRGTLGPSAVLYNPSAPNTGSDPRNYRFVMLYDATDGSTRRLGLAYSADGLLWSGTGAPVFGPGPAGAWDSGQVGLASVVLGGDGAYRLWYSGGQTSVTEGIGTAVSTDLVNWTRLGGSAPLWGAGRRGAPGSWNADGNFAPAVVFNANQFEGNGPAAFYKMWRVGLRGQSAYAIGYAQLNPADSLALVSGDGQAAQVGSSLPNPLVVRVRDACGNPVAGVPVRFAVESGPAGAQGYQFSNPVAVTDAAGLASTTFTFGPQVGLYQITASVPGAKGSPVRFTATSTGGSPATVRLGADPTAVEVGGQRARLVAIVTDSNSNPVPDGTVVTFETDHGSFGTGTTYITGTVNGEAVAYLLSSTQVATATVRAQVVGDSDAIRIQFVPGPPAAISGDAAPPIVSVGGATTQIRARITDRFGNPVADGTPVTFTTDLGDFNGQPSVSATTAGGQAFATLRSSTRAGTATVGVRSGASAYRAVYVTFVPDAPATLALSSDRPCIAVGGYSAELVAHVADRFGNPVADGTLVTFSTDLGTLNGGTVAVATTTDGAARIHLTSGMSTGTAHVRAESGAGSDQITVEFYNALTVQNEPWQTTICAGRPLRFTITVENTGDTILTNLLVRDILPYGSFFSAGGSSPGAQIFSDREVGWALGSLDAHSRKTLYLEVSTALYLTEGTTITNTVRVRANEAPEALSYSEVLVQCAAQQTPSPTPTRTASPTPSPTPTPTRTASPTASPTPSPTRTPTPTATPSPTPTPSPAPTATPTRTPTANPVPTSTRVPTRYRLGLPFVRVGKP